MEQKPKRKATTSSAVKERWNAKTYRRFTVQLRRDTDADAIAFLDKNRDRYSATDVFRVGIETLKTK